LRGNILIKKWRSSAKPRNFWQAAEPGHIPQQNNEIFSQGWTIPHYEIWLDKMERPFKIISSCCNRNCILNHHAPEKSNDAFQVLTPKGQS